MTRYLLFFLFILNFCFSFLVEANQLGPKAELRETVFDFGAVMPGQAVVHTFIIKNSGSEELKIKGVEFSELLSYSVPSSIAPGQEQNITLNLDTSNISGYVQAMGILYTNDPKHPEIELNMQGRIKSVIDIIPASAVFFSVYKGESSEKSVTIQNNQEKKPLKIIKIESKSNRFDYQLKTVKKGKEYSLLVKLNPEASPGRTMEKITLFTNDKNFPKLDVGVNIFVKNEVYTFPDLIDFGSINLELLKHKFKTSEQVAEFLNQTILVKRKEGKGKDFQIELFCDMPFLNITQEPKKGSETYRLDVRPIVEKMKPGKIDTFIKVKTNDKEVPELKIPVVGEVL